MKLAAGRRGETWEPFKMRGSYWKLRKYWIEKKNVFNIIMLLYTVCTWLPLFHTNQITLLPQGCYTLHSSVNYCEVTLLAVTVRANRTHGRYPQVLVPELRLYVAGTCDIYRI
jgi:hypothetical protein